MTDRSAIMRAVKSKNTAPEIAVRKIAHSLGYRFRLHRRDLPGSPDIVFPRLRKALFVHGCFWHGHRCKRGRRIPHTNTDYWTAKIERNRSRDRAAKRSLANVGWDTLVIWECEIRQSDKVVVKLSSFLSG